MLINSENESREIESVWEIFGDFSVGESYNIFLVDVQSDFLRASRLWRYLVK